MWSYCYTYPNELCHHGILGMKWGIRRYQNKDGTLTAEGKKRYGNEDTDETSSSSGKQTPSDKNRITELSDDELRSRISRLELEKRYKELSKSSEQKRVSKGKKFVMDVLESSGKNIASQLATYALGTAVNKVLATNAVNPKKGQKDK